MTEAFAKRVYRGDRVKNARLPGFLATHSRVAIKRCPCKAPGGRRLVAAPRSALCLLPMMGVTDIASAPHPFV